MRYYSLGSSFMQWALRIECALTGIGEEQPPFPTFVRRIFVTIVGSLIVSYYALHFLSIDNSFSLIFSIGLDCITCVTLYSVLWSALLTLAMGLDDPGLIARRREGSILPTLTSSVAQDPTTRRIGLGCILAYFIDMAGDMIFFIVLGWDHPDNHPNVSLALLYVLGSAITNAGLTLGSGYVAFVQNVFASQLQCLAHRLDREVSADMLNSPDYGSLALSGDDTETSSSQDRLTSERTSSLYHQMTGKELALTYVELRRRMDVLALSFHRKVALAVLAFFVEITLIVTAGFKEQGDDWTKAQLVGLLAMFFANSFSLWIMAFTFGRVHFVCREETAYISHKWAILRKDDAERATTSTEDKASMDAALMISRFPIRFHAGTFELNEELSKAITFLLLGLAGVFVGVHIPEL